jgi:hypothetical protein
MMKALLSAIGLTALLISGTPAPAHAAAIELDGIWAERDCRPLNLAGRSTPVTRWGMRALETICEGRPMPTIVSRELFLLHVAIYDAWSAYDSAAMPLYASAADRRPAHEHTERAKVLAIAAAAATVLIALFPDNAEYFRAQARHDGVSDAELAEPAAGSPAWIGVRAGEAVLAARAHDGANFAHHYADTSGYEPVNAPGQDTAPADPNRWQPLLVTNWDPALRPDKYVHRPQLFEPDEYGHIAEQMHITPHWPEVVPFALDSGDQLRPPAPPQYGSEAPYTDAQGNTGTSHQAYVDQFSAVMEMQTQLSEEMKVMAQMWSHDGGYFATPSGHWNHFAQQVSLRDDHSIDDDAKMFLALNGALLDAGIAAWDAKVAYDSVRPITAIRMLFAGRTIGGWLGRDKGFGHLPGEQWRPYQWTATISPAFAEYVSGHSAFAAAAAEILKRFSGSDRFHDPDVRVGDLDDDKYREAMGTYKMSRRRGAFDRLAPRHEVILVWQTFSEAAEQCGMSRIYGGVHIMDANLRALEMGRAIGDMAWKRAAALWSGG